MLNIKGITKVYRNQKKTVTALDGVSVNVEPGQFLAVSGPSGSGKSTLLFAAGSLLVPSSGEVLIDGQNPYEMSVERRAKLRADTIGFVFQQFYLIPYLTVYENILLPTVLTKISDAHKEAMNLIKRFGLNDRANHVVGELSTGEQQRTALARALINQPKIILADEPTGNLDKENAHIVIESLAEFANSGGAVLTVTHDEYVTQYAAKILYLEEGKIRND